MGGRVSIETLKAAFAKYVCLPSYDVVTVNAAVAVTARMSGDPTWLLNVAPASTAKTESVRLFDDVADERVDDLTIGGVLAWKAARKRGEPIATGILARHDGTSLFATIGDLSSLLATSDRGGRDVLFAVLRRAYDGEVHRDISPAPLSWRGRLTLLGAVTPSIDNYSAHADALGPRWLYFRLPALEGADRRAASRAARTHQGVVKERRAEAHPIADAVVEQAVARLAYVEVSEALGEMIDDCAEVACIGRAAVERSGYGKKEIIGLPSVEGPGRIAGQLHRLAIAMLALGMDHQEVGRLCRRVALDSMPLKRHQVLAALAHGEELNVAEVARRAGCHRHVARFALEELQTVGIVTYTQGKEEALDDDSTRTPRPWRLTGPDAQLVSRVFTDAGKGGTKRGNPSPQPPKDRHPSHVSCHPESCLEHGAAE